MKLAQFSIGQIISTGIAAVVFIIALHYLGKRNVPVARQLSQALQG